MKKLYLILAVIAITFFCIGCSADTEELSRTSNNGGELTFVLNANEQLSLITIRINDVENNTIKTYDFQNQQSINIIIDSGVKIIVYSVDEDDMQYNYQMINKNGSVQFEGFQFGTYNTTLIKNYDL